MVGEPGDGLAVSVNLYGLARRGLCTRGQVDLGAIW